jgi:hypothetical protein
MISVLTVSINLLAGCYLTLNVYSSFSNYFVISSAYPAVEGVGREGITGTVI